MSHLRYAAVAAGLLALAGCVSQVIPSTNYYMLEYYPQLENSDMIRQQPFPSTAQVTDTRISRTYDRKQIVVRDIGPRFSYSTTDLWGVSLPPKIADLVATRLQRYRVFSEVRREYSTESVDFEVATNVDAFELVRVDTKGQAHLEMDFVLTARSSGDSPVHHRVAREQALADSSVESFVIAANDMLLEETDRFISKIVLYLQTGQRSELFPAPTEGRLEPLTGESPNAGVILMPALTGTEQEPFYHVFGPSRTEVASAKMGVPVVLPEGRYRIEYGSGRENQLQEISNVLVVPRYKRVIEPTWGALTVSIVTEDRDFVKIGYEVFDAATGDSYGTDISANETLGEQSRAWILHPGLWKITIRNQPFVTYKDFTTLTLGAGDTKRLTIVVGVDQTGNPTDLVGAGVLEEGPGGQAKQPVRVTSTISGTTDFSSSNEIDPQSFETQTTVTGEVDTRLVVDLSPLLYTMRMLLDTGVTKSPDTDFRISSDDLILNNTLIYFFLKDVGLYSRFDVATHFFPEYVYFATAQNVHKRATDGTLLSSETNVLQTQVKPSFLPLILQEGAGLNFRVINLSRAELSVRAGLGLRQDFNGDVYTVTGTETVGPDVFQVYEEVPSQYQTGIEVSALGTVNLPFGLTYTLSSEVLFPFERGSQVSLDWENIFDLSLFRYLLLEYRLNLNNRVPVVPGHYFVVDHRLVLRLTYVVR